MGGGSLECEPVTVNSESADNAIGEIRQVRMLAEFFARMHIRQVDLDERYLRREEGIANRDAGVGIGRRIDDDEVDLVGSGLLDAIDDGAFTVRLEGLQSDAFLLCQTSQISVDLGERIGAIDFRLARAEQVQIGAMYD